MYRSDTYEPELVKIAKELAKKHHFKSSCIDEVGRLLAMFVAQMPSGKVLEIGTGYGVGSGWMLSHIPQKVTLVTIDHQLERMREVSNAFNHPQGTFLHGDWKDALLYEAYEFIFADAAVAKKEEAPQLFGALAIGGVLLMDDFTPRWKGEDDVRAYWLNHPSLIAMEINVTANSSVIIATKIAE